MSPPMENKQAKANNRDSQRYDLHVHSTASDGVFTPEELLQMAQEKGLSGLSFTDHDTFSAYTPKLFTLAKKLGLVLVPGIEISSLHKDKSTHILGYNFDLHSVSLCQFIEKLQKIRYERNLKILEKLQAKNIYIKEKELYPNGKGDFSKGRPQIAELIVKKKMGATFQSAFDLYLKEGASCYVAANKFTAEEVIGQIHQAGGKAVLAHPYQIKNKKQVASLLKLPFDGIEVYYGRLHSSQEKEWLEIAKQQEWLITGGSDFHGLGSAYNFMGCSWVDKKTLDLLLN